jgi:hypothetical protein
MFSVSHLAVTRVCGVDGVTALAGATKATELSESVTTVAIILFNMILPRVIDIYWFEFV